LRLWPFWLAAASPAPFAMPAIAVIAIAAVRAARLRLPLCLLPSRHRRLARQTSQCHRPHLPRRVNRIEPTPICPGRPRPIGPI